MIYLLLSILSSASIFLIFKLFEKYKIDNVQAILMNYLVAITMGILISGGTFITKIIHFSWFWNAAIIGTSFISLFVLMAVTAQKISISVSSVSNKMSVVIPVTMAFILYNDSITFLKIFGILLALIGVFLASIKKHIEVENKSLWLLPAIVFIANGFLDTFIKYTQQTTLPENETIFFLPVVFTFAFLSGLCFLILKRIFTKEKKQIEGKNLLWGIILGIPNYASIYFLIKTLELPNFESSVIFPINNMGIVAASSLFSFVFFKEHFSVKNWIGIILSILAIVLIAFS